MRTSVIIPNYNYGRYLPHAIDSVLNQTTPVDEIIVVDDGSTDSSKSILESYGDKITAIFQPNAGQAAAFNVGVKKATGDIIFLLDADDLFHSDKIKTIKKLYADYPDIGWIFHELKHINDDALKKSFKDAGTLDDTEMEIIDKISMMKNGKLDYYAPATSGLSFRKIMIDFIFPLPTAESIYISDHYIKFLALSSAKGIHIKNELGIQLIHEDNLYTGKTDHFKKARLFINTAYHLKQKQSSLGTFCDNLYADALLSYSKAGKPKELDTFIRQYGSAMSILQKAKINLKFWIKKSRLA
ncbi:MAG: glycosyltransferase family 2 protein [Alphaproteobacteria bacterium]|nr:glycosyltransferase family 2 protein [Alphaproteobacteria bacterium]